MIIHFIFNNYHTYSLILIIHFNSIKYLDTENMHNRNIVGSTKINYLHLVTKIKDFLVVGINFNYLNFISNQGFNNNFSYYFIILEYTLV